jgi:hypothetical protein
VRVLAAAERTITRSASSEAASLLEKYEPRGSMRILSWLVR